MSEAKIETPLTERGGFIKDATGANIAAVDSAYVAVVLAALNAYFGQMESALDASVEFCEEYVAGGFNHQPFEEVGNLAEKHLQNYAAAVTREKDARIAELEKCEKFALWVLRAHFGNDSLGVEGDVMERLGLDAGVMTRRTVAEPCGEGCACAGFDFPLECNRIADGLLKS